MERSKLRYAVEKFTNAVDVLATDRRRIKDRVYLACLAIHTVRPDENLPPRLRKDYDWIQKQITKWPGELIGEGSIKASLRRMRVGTAEKIAERIFHIYHEVLEDWCTR